MIADYPAFQRSLSRQSLTDSSLNRLFAAYLVFLFYCVERQSAISASAGLREPFLTALRTEIALRFFGGTERPHAIAALDDLVNAARRDFDECAYPASAATPMDRNLLFRFGEVVSGLAGQPGNSEIVGPVMSQLKGTVDRLSLVSVLTPLGPPDGASAV